jgi:hypothetical protein
MGGQHHDPADLPQGKTRYPLYRRLGGPQGQSGRVRKISTPPGFDLRTVQSVWALPALQAFIESENMARSLDYVYRVEIGIVSRLLHPPEIPRRMFFVFSLSSRLLERNVIQSPPVTKLDRYKTWDEDKRRTRQSDVMRNNKCIKSLICFHIPKFLHGNLFACFR